METKSLVRMAMEFAAVERDLVESGGVLSPELEQALDLGSGDIRDKVDRYFLFSESLNSRAAYFKTLENQCKHAREVMDNTRELLKANVKAAMQTLGVTDLEGNNYRYKLSALADKLVIDGEIPEAYYKKVTKVELVLDKEALIGDLLLGAKVQGARLETNAALRSYVSTKPKTIKGK